MSTKHLGEEIKCARCGKMSEKKSPNQKYCSQECRAYMQSEMVGAGRDIVRRESTDKDVEDKAVVSKEVEGKELVSKENIDWFGENPKHEQIMFCVFSLHTKDPLKIAQIITALLGIVPDINITVKSHKEPKEAS